MTDIDPTSVIQLLQSIHLDYKNNVDARRNARTASEKPGDGYTTDLDLRVDNYLSASLRKICNIEYFSEESIKEAATHANPPAHFWLVDPLDGTMNAIIGIPYFSVAVSLVVHHRIIQSFVLNLANGDIYHAARGRGFMKNGMPVRRRSLADKTIFSTGFAHDRRLHKRQLDVMSGLLPHIDEFRRLASPCLDLCLIAEGVLDGCVEFLKGWDFAAGTLFLEEVGMMHNHTGMFHPAELCDQFHFAAAERSLMPIVMSALQTGRH